MGTLVRTLFVGAALVVWTWLWFLPVAGFHHLYRCGLLGWAIVDEENGPTEFRWSGPLLVASVVAWVAGLWAARALRVTREVRSV